MRAAPPVDVDGDLDPDAAAHGPVADAVDAAGHRQFKKHKVLPRPPHNDRGLDRTRRTPPMLNLSIDSTAPSASQNPLLNPRGDNFHNLNFSSSISGSSNGGGNGTAVTSTSTFNHRNSNSHQSIRSSSPQPSSPHTLKHQPRRIGTGPDLPPTPPTHSRASSGSHSVSAIPSSPTGTEHSVNAQLPQLAIKRPPATPPDQRSPPTPDVTPPQPVTLTKALRPNMRARGASSTSNIAPSSRTESFKTAREEATSSSEDEGGASVISPAVSPGPSVASQVTIRNAPGTANTRLAELRPTDGTPKRQKSASPSLSLSPSSSSSSPSPNQLRNRVRPGEPVKNSGGRRPVNEAVRRQDDRLQQTMNSMKRKPVPRRPISKHQPRVVEDEVTAGPTNATDAVRQTSLRETSKYPPSPKRGLDRRATAPAQSPGLPLPMSTDTQKSSSASIKSVGNVVEVLLLDTTPMRQKTLRHVRKNISLRDSTSTDTDSETAKEYADLSSAVLPTKMVNSPRQSTVSRVESYASATTTTTTTSRSLSSNKARREIWKSGAIPVIIVPDRKSSRGGKGSREPSLRSTSSRRSKRTGSSGSSIQDSPRKKSGPVFERPQRRSRAYSDSDRSERTIDFPPIIPTRSSSLSAPTSRNVSRANSVRSGSVRSREARPPSIRIDKEVEVVDEPEKRPAPEPVGIEPSPPPLLAPHFSPEVRVYSPNPSVKMTPASPELRDLKPAETRDSLDFHRYDDASLRKFSSRNTPFSVISMETCGTPLQLQEAQAVHMYPHQNSSLLVVNHSGRVSDERDEKRSSGASKLQRTSTGDRVPVTPPQKQFGGLLDVDSPLRNPRAPPQPPKYPPAINLIPATPSGNTPLHMRDAQQENFFASLREKPPRRLSLVKRALSKRRHSIDYTPEEPKPTSGFLTRTFSLSRQARRGHIPTFVDVRPDMEGNSVYPQSEDKPSEEDRLHPFWRPQGEEDEQEFNEDDLRGEYTRDDEIYRYPPVDNRPRAPARSLSARVKRTFAILPSQEYSSDDMYGPSRRTIQRTASGNLRVMRRRVSSDSIKRPRSPQFRKASPVRSEKPPRSRSFFRSQSLTRGKSVDSTKLTRRFSIGSKLEELQNIPQMISERRREKRTQQLRQMISGPKVVRDGVGEVIRCGNPAARHHAATQF